MSSGVFLIQDDGALVGMREERYEREVDFQGLLASYPDLLAGDQVNQADPRQWLLVTREAAVPGEEDGGARWSIDHLFLDQDGIPTLVEVKRSGDARLRREVVGQMLDYAANAVAYWPVEKLRAWFEKRCEMEGLDCTAALRGYFGETVNEDQFWGKVKTNLQAGRVRMLFVADEIQSDLQRIVEFLNMQMDPAEVLVVEIRQYVSEGRRILVPRVLGQTEQAKGKKGPQKQREEPWDEASFVERFSQSSPEDMELVQRFISWAKKAELECAGGRGLESATLSFGNSWVKPLWLWEGYTKSPFVQLAFEKIIKLPEGPVLVRHLCEKLNRIDGVELSPDQRWPSIKLGLLKEPSAWGLFTEAVSGLFNALATVTEPR